MSPLRLLLAEIRFRKLNFAMSLLAVAIAVTLFVAAPMLVDGYRQETRAQSAEVERETRRIMRDLGFNLMIVHRDTNMSDFWDRGFAAMDMPQEYVDRLAVDRRLTYVAHLVATLQSRIPWQGRTVLLVGYLPETAQPNAHERSPMGYNIKPGTVFVGYELGHGRKVGETIDILGRPFQIARLLREKGSKEDITLAVHLEDAQTLLGKPERITQIMALECRCPGADVSKIRQQLAEVLPQTKITEFQSIALARAEQRALVEASGDLVERRLRMLAQVALPLVVVAAAVWVGLLSLANVRERRAEIGVLRALGKGSGLIAGLLLGKAVLVGLLGGLIGLVAGAGLAVGLGVWVLKVAAANIALPYPLLLGALLGAPVLSALAGYLPMLVALMQDPAVVLREG